MNIFFLDNDPKLAARYHVDRHVVKMILESSQLMCTAVNHFAGRQVTPYKTTHLNHPCSKWVRESFQNFDWLHQLTLELNAEYRYRYRKNSDHASVIKMKEAKIRDLAKSYFPNNSVPFTNVALAMPDECKLEDPVKSYRNYYLMYKRPLFKWTNREQPEWVISND